MKGMGLVMKILAVVGAVALLLFGINAVKPGGLDENKETFY